MGPISKRYASRLRTRLPKTPNKRAALPDSLTVDPPTRSNNITQTLEGGDGDGDAPAAKSLQDLTSSSKKNTEELDDERQYRMLQQDLHGDRGEAARWGTGEVRVCAAVKEARGWKGRRDRLM